MLRSFKYRIYLNPAQEAELTEMLGAFCDLYNAGLQQRIEAYQRRGISLRYGNQANELKACREADERLARYSYSAEQQVLRRLDKTFSAFFGRIQRGEKAGFPRFRAKQRFDSAEFRVGDGLTIRRKSNRIGIVGIPGEIKCKWHRPLPEHCDVKSAVVTRNGGRWYICFHLQVKEQFGPPEARPFTPVGIDIGLTSLVALDNAETVPTPQYTALAAPKLRRLQRAVARKKRHSKQQRKAKLRVARLSAHIANQRRDNSHKLSRKLVNCHSHIAMEDLNIKGLAAGMLAKSVHNAAWNQLAQHIRYKAESAGSVFRLVNPRGTSQECPACHAIKPKALSERMHRCECGCVMDRDAAAGMIVLQRAQFGAWNGPLCGK